MEENNSKKQNIWRGIAYIIIAIYFMYKGLMLIILPDTLFVILGVLTFLSGIVLFVVAIISLDKASKEKAAHSEVVPPAVVPPTPKPRWEFIPGPVENIQQIAVPVNSEFNLTTFQQAVFAEYYHHNAKKMAYAAATIAKLISENFDTKDVRCMVPAWEIDPNASHNTLPVHFLFMKNGQPKVAVVIVTDGGYKHPYVLATKDVCHKNNVAYLRVFANGNLADWLEGKAKPGIEDMCKFRIAYNIKRALN